VVPKTYVLDATGWAGPDVGSNALRSICRVLGTGGHYGSKSIDEKKGTRIARADRKTDARSIPLVKPVGCNRSLPTDRLAIRAAETELSRIKHTFCDSLTEKSSLWTAASL
jgi:hypothetical protein